MVSLKAIVYTLLGMLFFLSPLAAERHQLAVAAVFQNEAPYLREWIEFHRLMGATHFYLYNNESQDDFMAALAPYIAEGIVELIDWPNRWPEELFCTRCQLYAYDDALSRARGNADWLAIIDVDEYLFPTKESTLIAYLERHCNDVSGLVVNWQCYGTSNVDLGPCDLMTERLTLRAVSGHKKHKDYKSIVRPEDVVYCANQHYCRYVEGKHAINELGEAVDDSYKGSSVGAIRINHYWLKDRTFFQTIKVPRLMKRGFTLERIEALDAEFNQVSDEAIHRFLPALKASSHVAGDNNKNRSHAPIISPEVVHKNQPQSPQRAKRGYLN